MEAAVNAFSEKVFEERLTKLEAEVVQLKKAIMGINPVPLSETSDITIEDFGSVESTPKDVA